MANFRFNPDDRFDPFAPIGRETGERVGSAPDQRRDAADERLDKLVEAATRPPGSLRLDRARLAEAIRREPPHGLGRRRRIFTFGLSATAAAAAILVAVFMWIGRGTAPTAPPGAGPTAGPAEVTVAVGVEAPDANRMVRLAGQAEVTVARVFYPRQAEPQPGDGQDDQRRTEPIVVSLESFRGTPLAADMPDPVTDMLLNGF